jgi:hypothetical protein
MTTDPVESVLVSPSYKAIRASPYVVNNDSYDGTPEDYFARAVRYNPGSRENAIILDSLQLLRASSLFLEHLRRADLVVLETSVSRQWVSENRALRNADRRQPRTAIMINLEHLQVVAAATATQKSRTVPASWLMTAVSVGAIGARIGLAKLF